MLRASRDLDHGDLSTKEEWEGVLKLASRWSFSSLRARALRKLDALISSYERLLIARAYDVDEWVEEALHGLCTRSESLTLDEANRMQLEDVVFVAEVRERARASDDQSWEDLSSKVDEYIVRRRQEAQGGGDDDDHEASQVQSADSAEDKTSGL